MKHKKKIIISSYDDIQNPIYAGGGAYSVHETAKRLSKNFQVTVITGTYKNARNVNKDKVEYKRVGSSFFGHKLGQIIFQLALIKQALSLSYDLWLESATPPFTFSLLPLFVKKPIINWVGMLSSEDMKRKYYFDFSVIERMLAKLYKNMIIPTNWVKDEILKMNSKVELDLIPCGFSKPLKSVKSKNKIPNLDRKYLLFLGRIEVNQKGIDLLLRALSKTKKDVFLVLAGYGSSREMEILNKLIRKFELEERVLLTGRVDGMKKAILLNNAHASIVSSRFETFSLTALESISYRTSVIHFAIDQLSWIPNKFSYKIKPFDVNKLTVVLDKLYSQKRKKLAVGEVNKFLKNYSWDNIAFKIEDVITKLI